MTTPVESDSISNSAEEIPLGIKNPLLTHQPLGQKLLHPNFLYPLGAKQLAGFDPSAFSLGKMGRYNLLQEFQDFPFFDNSLLSTSTEPLSTNFYNVTSSHAHNIIQAFSESEAIVENYNEQFIQTNYPTQASKKERKITPKSKTKQPSTANQKATITTENEQTLPKSKSAKQSFSFSVNEPKTYPEGQQILPKSESAEESFIPSVKESQNYSESQQISPKSESTEKSFISSVNELHNHSETNQVSPNLEAVEKINDLSLNSANYKTHNYSETQPISPKSEPNTKSFSSVNSKANSTAETQPISPKAEPADKPPSAPFNSANYINSNIREIQQTSLNSDEAEEAYNQQFEQKEIQNLLSESQNISEKLGAESPISPSKAVVQAKQEQTLPEVKKATDTTISPATSIGDLKPKSFLPIAQDNLLQPSTKLETENLSEIAHNQINQPINKASEKISITLSHQELENIDAENLINNISEPSFKHTSTLRIKAKETIANTLPNQQQKRADSDTFESTIVEKKQPQIANKETPISPESAQVQRKIDSLSTSEAADTTVPLSTINNISEQGVFEETKVPEQTKQDSFSYPNDTSHTEQKNVINPSETSIIKTIEKNNDANAIAVNLNKQDSIYPTQSIPPYSGESDSSNKERSFSAFLEKVPSQVKNKSKTNIVKPISPTIPTTSLGVTHQPENLVTQSVQKADSTEMTMPEDSAESSVQIPASLESLTIDKTNSLTKPEQSSSSIASESSTFQTLKETRFWDGNITPAFSKNSLSKSELGVSPTNSSATSPTKNTIHSTTIQPLEENIPFEQKTETIKGFTDAKKTSANPFQEEVSAESKIETVQAFTDVNLPSQTTPPQSELVDLNTSLTSPLKNTDEENIGSAQKTETIQAFTDANLPSQTTSPQPELVNLNTTPASSVQNPIQENISSLQEAETNQTFTVANSLSQTTPPQPELINLNTTPASPAKNTTQETSVQPIQENITSDQKNETIQAFTDANSLFQTISPQPELINLNTTPASPAKNTTQETSVQPIQENITSDQKNETIQAFTDANSPSETTLTQSDSANFTAQTKAPDLPPKQAIKTDSESRVRQTHLSSSPEFTSKGGEAITNTEAIEPGISEQTNISSIKLTTQNLSLDTINSSESATAQTTLKSHPPSKIETENTATHSITDSILPTGISSEPFASGTPSLANNDEPTSSRTTLIDISSSITSEQNLVQAKPEFEQSSLPVTSPQIQQLNPNELSIQKVTDPSNLNVEAEKISSLYIRENAIGLPNSPAGITEVTPTNLPVKRPGSINNQPASEVRVVQPLAENSPFQASREKPTSGVLKPLVNFAKRLFGGSSDRTHQTIPKASETSLPQQSTTNLPIPPTNHQVQANSESTVVQPYLDSSTRNLSADFPQIDSSANIPSNEYLTENTSNQIIESNVSSAATCSYLNTTKEALDSATIAPPPPVNPASPINIDQSREVEKIPEISTPSFPQTEGTPTSSFNNILSLTDSTNSVVNESPLVQAKSENESSFSTSSSFQNGVVDKIYQIDRVDSNPQSEIIHSKANEPSNPNLNIEKNLRLASVNQLQIEPKQAMSESADIAETPIQNLEEAQSTTANNLSEANSSDFISTQSSSELQSVQQTSTSLSHTSSTPESTSTPSKQVTPSHPAVESETPDLITTSQSKVQLIPENRENLSDVITEDNVSSTFISESANIQKNISATSDCTSNLNPSAIAPDSLPEVIKTSQQITDTTNPKPTESISEKSPKTIIKTANNESLSQNYLLGNSNVIQAKFEDSHSEQAQPGLDNISELIDTSISSDFTRDRETELPNTNQDKQEYLTNQNIQFQNNSTNSTTIYKTSDSSQSNIQTNLKTESQPLRSLSEIENYNLESNLPDGGDLVADNQAIASHSSATQSQINSPNNTTIYKSSFSNQTTIQSKLESEIHSLQPSNVADDSNLESNQIVIDDSVRNSSHSPTEQSQINLPSNTTIPKSFTRNQPPAQTKVESETQSLQTPDLANDYNQQSNQIEFENYVEGNQVITSPPSATQSLTNSPSNITISKLYSPNPTTIQSKLESEAHSLQTSTVADNYNLESNHFEGNQALVSSSSAAQSQTNSSNNTTIYKSDFPNQTPVQTKLENETQLLQNFTAPEDDNLESNQVQVGDFVRENQEIASSLSNELCQMKSLSNITISELYSSNQTTIQSKLESETHSLQPPDAANDYNLESNQVKVVNYVEENQAIASDYPTAQSQIKSPSNTTVSESFSTHHPPAQTENDYNPDLNQIEIDNYRRVNQEIASDSPTAQSQTNSPSNTTISESDSTYQSFAETKLESETQSLQTTNVADDYNLESNQVEINNYTGEKQGSFSRIPTAKSHLDSSKNTTICEKFSSNESVIQPKLESQPTNLINNDEINYFLINESQLKKEINTSSRSQDNKVKIPNITNYEKTVAQLLLESKSTPRLAMVLKNLGQINPLGSTKSLGQISESKMPVLSQHGELSRTSDVLFPTIQTKIDRSHDMPTENITDRQNLSLADNSYDSDIYSDSASVPQSWSSIEELLRESHGSNHPSSVQRSQPTIQRHTNRMPEEDNYNSLEVIKYNQYPSNQQLVQKVLTSKVNQSSDRSTTNNISPIQAKLEPSTGQTQTASISNTANRPTQNSIKPDKLEMLAQEIYSYLRQRLEVERERQGRYNSGRLPW